MEKNFCRKTISQYLQEGYYEQAGATIKLLIPKNPREAENIFLSECYAVMKTMFDGSPNPRKALDLISGVAEHIPEDWQNNLKKRYTHHMAHDLRIVDEKEGN